VVKIGKVIAIIATEGEEVSPTATPTAETSAPSNGVKQETPAVAEVVQHQATPAMAQTVAATGAPAKNDNGRFYSPLVRNIAKQENISINELANIQGSGQKGRVTKKDILSYVKNRVPGAVQSAPAVAKSQTSTSSTPTTTLSSSGNVEIVEMDRMRKLIADHMVMSKHTSPHVTSFIEVDVTNLVNWRNKVKGGFQQKHGQKITFTPIFIEAIVKAIGDYPMVNVSLEGKNILIKKDINIGMAAALPSGNLIVPVIKNADQLNLTGLTKSVNDLASRARNNKLKPEEIQGGTFTLTNVGTFGNVMGTPIINQPQVAIMAAGAIRKKPAVLETEYGDVIAIRQLMFLSLSYDHRIVDGMLGGSFLRRVGDYLEAFDHEQTI